MIMVAYFVIPETNDTMSASCWPYVLSGIPVCLLVSPNLFCPEMKTTGNPSCQAFKTPVIALVEAQPVETKHTQSDRSAEHKQLQQAASFYGSCKQA